MVVHAQARCDGVPAGYGAVDDRVVLRHRCRSALRSWTRSECNQPSSHRRPSGPDRARSHARSTPESRRADGAHSRTKQGLVRSARRSLAHKTRVGLDRDRRDPSQPQGCPDVDRPHPTPTPELSGSATQPIATNPGVAETAHVATRANPRVDRLCPGCRSKEPQGWSRVLVVRLRPTPGLPRPARRAISSTPELVASARGADRTNPRVARSATVATSTNYLAPPHVRARVCGRFPTSRAISARLRRCPASHRAHRHRSRSRPTRA